MSTTYATTPESIGLICDALRREGQIVRCPRCKRELNPWPLGHKSCAPRDWALCLTTGVAHVVVEAPE